MVGYIGKEPTVGNFIKLDSITTSATTTFNLLNGGVAYSPENARVCQVVLNGVLQNPETSFNIVGSTIVFSQALTSDDVIDYILVLGDTLSVGTPSDATVSTAKIVDSAVTSAKVNDNAITTAKINNDAVTEAKLNLISTSSVPSLEAKGDGSSDGYIQLNCSQNSHGIKLKSPPHSANASYVLTFPNNDGNASEVLTTDGAGVLTWGAVSSDWVKIAHTNVTSAVSSVDFVHGTGGVVIDSTYRFYKVMCTWRPEENGAILNVQVANSGTFRTTGYLSEVFRSYYSGGTSRANGTSMLLRGTGGTQDATEQRSNAELTFYNMSDASLNTTGQLLSQAIDGNGNTENQVNNQIGGGVYASPEAHNGIRIKMHTDFIKAGEFTLYGIKG